MLRFARIAIDIRQQYTRFSLSLQRAQSDERLDE